MKIRGYILGDAKARQLLAQRGIRGDHPDFDRCLRIAAAYFAFDELGDADMRDRIFGQVLSEVGERTKDNQRRDAGQLRQKINRHKAQLDADERPWLAYFTERAIATGSQAQAATDTKRRYKLVETADAIRMQARRAQLVAPRKQRSRRTKR